MDATVTLIKLIFLRYAHAGPAEDVDVEFNKKYRNPIANVKMAFVTVDCNVIAMKIVNAVQNLNLAKS